MTSVSKFCFINVFFILSFKSIMETLFCRNITENFLKGWYTRKRKRSKKSSDGAGSDSKSGNPNI